MHIVNLHFLKTIAGMLNLGQEENGFIWSIARMISSGVTSKLQRGNEIWGTSKLVIWSASKFEFGLLKTLLKWSWRLLAMLVGQLLWYYYLLIWWQRMVGL